MPSHAIELTCPVFESFNVQQIAGMFDLTLDESSCVGFEVELPSLDEDWQIGLIVGPSGSGKSSIAREVYQDQMQIEHSWPPDHAVIDCFGDLSAKKVAELFTAVGFGSPPSWVKPFQVLSNGEQFRCNLARSLSVGMTSEGECPLVVMDEFTSVVDRNVAKIASAAINKGIRKESLPCRFVAVSCHYDIAEWLAPDWVLDMATGKLSRRCLRQPSIKLEIYRCRLEAWRLFARHHYLTGTLAPQARCYLATWQGEPVAFAATLPVITKKGHRRFSRIVTLPDFQGVGIGMRFVAAVAQLHRDEGLRINVTSSHPTLIRHCQYSPLWKTIVVKKQGQGKRKSKSAFSNYQSSRGRAVVSFEYLGKE